MKLGYPNYMMNDNTLNQIYASVSWFVKLESPVSK